MTTVRTIFQPWQDLDVDDAEAAALAAQGLLVPEPPAPVEEVNTHGSSEEGGSQERDGLRQSPSPDREEVRSQPTGRSGNPRVLDTQGIAGGEEGQPEPEKDHTEEEGKVI